MIDLELLENTKFSFPRLGSSRWQFIQQSLQDLQQQLDKYQQRLILKVGQPSNVIAKLIDTNNISHIAINALPAVYEKNAISVLEQKYENRLNWHVGESFTLLEQCELPFDIADMPDGFTPFRKRIEKAIKPPQISHKVIDKPITIPPSIDSITSDELPKIPAFDISDETMEHRGGEQAAQQQLNAYTFESKALSSYKETRNGLDGWGFSSKLSAYLSQGCISPRQVMQTVLDYEQQVGANQSTYWLYFELLWREFYQWHQEKYAEKLYQKDGIRGIDPQLIFNESDFRCWQQGETKSDFVNAFMRQLKLTGWMSNRGRQIVASYFVNQLNLDWRYGAAWFEYQLIDYDPANNWGNWQYLAGVGVDPRGRRAFNIDKQQKMYDPYGKFTFRYTQISQTKL